MIHKTPAVRGANNVRTGAIATPCLSGQKQAWVTGSEEIHGIISYQKRGKPKA